MEPSGWRPSGRSRGEVGKPPTRKRGVPEGNHQNRSRLEQYEALCKQLSEPPAAIALAWLLNNLAVTAPIIGPRTIEQMDSTLRATEITLSEETLKKLDEIFPTA